MNVPYKNLDGKPRNATLYFNLFEREVFKLLVEFQFVFGWLEARGKAAPDDVLDSVEVVEFYNNFEEIVLSAYGKPVEDGEEFDHSGRYAFEQSARFNGLMVMCLKDPTQTTKLVNGLMPEGLAELVKTADANMVAAVANAETPEAIRDQIEKLRAQLPASETPTE